MKSIVFISAITVILFSSFRSSIADVGNDLCKSYFPLEIGTELTYENYTAGDKLEGVDYFSVTDIIESPESLIIKVHSAYQDKKGKELNQSDFEYKCEGGVFKMSLDHLLSPDMTESMEGMEGVELEFTQTELQMPNNMAIGQDLPDAQMTLKAKMNGMELMSMKFDITERKAEALESVTTAAGTFDCIKLSQKTTSNVMGMTRNYKSIDWFAVNIGSVRSEMYNESGALETYRVLTNIKR